MCQARPDAKHHADEARNDDQNFTAAVIAQPGGKHATEDRPDVLEGNEVPLIRLWPASAVQCMQREEGHDHQIAHAGKTRGDQLDKLRLCHKQSWQATQIAPIAARVWMIMMPGGKFAHEKLREPGQK